MQTQVSPGVRSTGAVLGLLTSVTLGENRETARLANCLSCSESASLRYLAIPVEPLNFDIRSPETEELNLTSLVDDSR